VRRPATQAAAQFCASDSGDHPHPNDAGYKAMGETIDLALQSGSALTRSSSK
jgi:hypothetical protein